MQQNLFNIPSWLRMNPSQAFSARWQAVFWSEAGVRWQVKPSQPDKWQASQATLFWQVTGETNLFNIFRLCWYGFFVRLVLWSVLLPLWHKHPVTTRWWGQPGHGKAWLGKGAVKLTDGEAIKGAWVIGFSQSLKIECGWCNSPREWCNVNKSSQWLPNTPFASISECLVS